MTISRIESLVYGVQDMEAAVRYFEDWGLPCSERGNHGAEFTTPAGQSILIRLATESSLPAAVEDGSTVREVIWGVDNARSLEKIAAELSHDREVKAGRDGTLHARDDSGFAIGFRRVSPRGKGASRKKPASVAARMNQPFDPERRARPTRIGHVVYCVTRNDLDKATAFYQKRLQFRLSDGTPGGNFMRCQGTNDHHSLFLLSRPDRRAFDHIAFEVRNIDEIILGGNYMLSRGWRPNTAVGRHILGSNLFWYFNNPCGGRTEYYADMDQMDDDWKPRIWEKHPGYAMWMLSKAEIPELTHV